MMMLMPSVVSISYGQMEYEGKFRKKPGDPPGSVKVVPNPSLPVSLDTVGIDSFGFP